MSRLQRRLLAAVGILSLVVAVAAIAAANREPGTRGAVLSASADDSADLEDDDEAADTTERRGAVDRRALAPVRGGTALPPTTGPAPPPTPATEPPSTTTTAPPPALDARGSFFGPPADTTTRTSAGDCRTLATATWSAESCGTATSASGPITWLIETKGKGWRALLLKPAGVGQWTPHLAASDDSGARWSEVKAKVVEGPGGSNDQVLGVGFRVKTGSTLAVDLIQGGQVVAHTDLAKGSARLSRAQLDIWSAQADGSYAHHTVRWRSEAWRIVESEKVPASLVPPSHL